VAAVVVVAAAMEKDRAAAAEPSFNVFVLIVTAALTSKSGVFRDVQERIRLMHAAYQNISRSSLLLHINLMRST
jgi:hypothetical protein